MKDKLDRQRTIALSPGEQARVAAAQIAVAKLQGAANEAIAALNEAQRALGSILTDITLTHGLEPGNAHFVISATRPS